MTVLHCCYSNNDWQLSTKNGQNDMEKGDCSYLNPLQLFPSYLVKDKTKVNHRTTLYYYKYFAITRVQV